MARFCRLILVSVFVVALAMIMPGCNTGSGTGSGTGGGNSTDNDSGGDKKNKSLEQEKGPKEGQVDTNRPEK